MNLMVTAAGPSRYVRVPVGGHGVVQAVWYRHAGALAGSSLRVAARTFASVVAHLDEARVESRPAGAWSTDVLTARAVGFDAHPWATPAQLATLERAVARVAFEASFEKYVHAVLARCDTGLRADDVSALATALDVAPDRATLRAIAIRAAVSPRTLRRRFASAVGMSADRYRVVARAARARELLMATRTPLATLAYDLGYADQSHLHRDVLELSGATPTQWRGHGAAWRSS